MPFDLALTPDQQAVEEVFGAFFAKESPPDVVRSAEPLGFAPELWAALRSIEACGMGVPESSGGGGASLSDLVVVCEQLGRAAAPVPLVDHLVASRCHPRDDLVNGDVVGAVALTPSANGVWRLVPAGAVAGVVVGVDGEDLVAVRSQPPMRAPDNHASAPLADRSSTDGQREVIGSASDFAAVLDEWRVLTAAALVGVARAALDIAVAYVRERHQFGRPIGGFQAIQHGLADVVPLVDGAALLVHKAAWASEADVQPDHDDLVDPRILATMAFLVAADAAATTTAKSLQYHGGYGFSREYDIQLYFRRARGWAAVLGSPSRQRARLSDLLWPREVN